MEQLSVESNLTVLLKYRLSGRLKSKGTAKVTRQNLVVFVAFGTPAAHDRAAPAQVSGACASGDAGGVTPHVVGAGGKIVP
jgi:hypothetical protein